MRLYHECDMTHPRVSRYLYICVTGRIQMCDKARSHVWWWCAAWPSRLSWLIRRCDVTRAHVWHECLTCVVMVCRVAIASFALGRISGTLVIPRHTSNRWYMTYLIPHVTSNLYSFALGRIPGTLVIPRRTLNRCYITYLIPHVTLNVYSFCRCALSVSKCVFVYVLFPLQIHVTNNVVLCGAGSVDVLLCVCCCMFCSVYWSFFYCWVL